MQDKSAKNKRKEMLELTVSNIDKRFGKGSIMRWDDNYEVLKDVISTGSISLDYALGVGGIPRGRVVEIYGQPATGKSTLSLHMIANCQKAGGTCAFIDTEFALDPKYTSSIGIKLSDLLISQPSSAEEALEIADTLIRSSTIDLIVLDSVAALVPRAELEGEMGQHHISLQARLMSQALRKLTASISKTNCSMIFINQLREKVGVVFGSPFVTPGGRALKFYSSIRIEVKRLSAIKNDIEILGNRVKAIVVKNKVASPFRSTEFDIIFGEGISYEGDVIDFAVNLGVLDKAGSWYSYNGDKLGRGRDNLKSILKEDNKLLNAIVKDINKHIGV